MIESLIPYLLFSGILQGIILTSAAIYFHSGKAADTFLILFIVTYTLDIGYALYTLSGLSLIYPQYIGLSAILPFLYAPSLFLFSRFRTEETETAAGRDYLHLIPAGIFIVLIFISYFIIPPAERAALADKDAGKLWYVFLIRASIPVYGIVYLLLSFLQIKKFHRRLLDNYSAIENRNLRWLIYLISGISVVWILELVQTILIDFLGYPDRIAYGYIYSAVSLFFSGVLFRAVVKPGIFSSIHFSDNSSPEELAPGIDSVSVKPLLTDAQTDAAIAALHSLMVDSAPYHNPDLTLPELASMINTTPQRLSWLFNHKLNTTFYDYVNNFRVKEVIRMMQEDTSSSFTLIALAYDAGFSSKSTFNSVFKKITGETPSAYRNRLFRN